MIKISGTRTELDTEFYYMSKELKDDKVYDLEIKEHKDKRSIDQNAYYWKLLYLYAKWANENVNVLHNQMLSAYGVSTGYYAIVPEEDNFEIRSDLHLKRTSQTKIGTDKKVYVYCQIMKGSHELKTDEMTHLIDGLINEIIGSGADSEINVEG